MRIAIIAPPWAPVPPKLYGVIELVVDRPATGLDAADFPFGDGRGGYCLFLGRMSPDKGAHRALEAAHKAGVPLVIAAKMRDPAEYEYFEQYVQPYLNDSLRYLGEVPHEQKLE